VKCVYHMCETVSIIHLSKFQEMVGKQFFVSAEQLVKTDLDIRLERFCMEKFQTQKLIRPMV
jgi:hypothetical protein